MKIISKLKKSIRRIQKKRMLEEVEKQKLIILVFIITKSKIVIQKIKMIIKVSVTRIIIILQKQIIKIIIHQ
jgi:hypothetical protein